MVEVLELKCTKCGLSIIREARYYRYELKKNPAYLPFCSNKCSTEYKKLTGLFHDNVEIECGYCGKKCKKSNNDFKKSKIHFCCLKCRTRYYNKERVNNGYSLKNKIKEILCTKCACLAKVQVNTPIKNFICFQCKKIEGLYVKKARHVGRPRKIKSIRKDFLPSNAKKTKRLCVLAVCKICNKPFLLSNKGHAKYCDKCLKIAQQRAGLKSAATRKDTKRSKNEMLLGELCQEKYTNVTFNDPIFDGWDADILLHDYKLAIHWNGPWHYKYCGGRHSVAQVQARDKIKHDTIERKGWKNYIIKDDGKFNPEFVKNSFNALQSYIDKLNTSDNIVLEISDEKLL